MIEHYTLENTPHYFDEENKTLIIIKRQEPYRYLTVKVPKDIRHLSETEIKQEALEQIYKEEFAERANLEQFSDINSQLEVLNGATMDIANMLIGLLPQEESELDG